MLRRLRWQFSLLYVLAAAMLIALIGGGSYSLLLYYFESSTDLALQYKVALEFVRSGQSIPPDLQAADQAWQVSRRLPTPTPTKKSSQDDSDHEDSEANKPETKTSTSEGEDLYNSELSSIFLLRLDASGQAIAGFSTPALAPDSQAAQAAMLNGSDFRTVRLSSGGRVRLFTYRVNTTSGAAVLQVGRSLDDQDRLLNQLISGLLVLGGVCVLGVGLVSWWLAGRSLDPAQRAWDRQQTFVANASHELRTPLTLLRASAEVARHGLEAQEPRYELLSDILQESDHMARLVDDLLLLSRLDTGRLKLERQPVDMAVLLGELGREMGRVANGRNVNLEVLQAQGAALADATRLRQVLLGLLDNALRHTPAGGTITLAAFPEGGRIVCRVSDSGVGIAAHHLPHVFERFYRGEQDRSQAASGSGLGLAIAKGLVEAMHGQINLTSQPGQGTQVVLSLPAVGRQ